MCKALAHRWGAHGARSAQRLRARPCARPWLGLWHVRSSSAVRASCAHQGRAIAEQQSKRSAKTCRATDPGRERLVIISSLSHVIGKANGTVRTPQAPRHWQSDCRVKALCEAVQPCALHARTKGEQLLSAKLWLIVYYSYWLLLCSFALCSFAQRRLDYHATAASVNDQF